MKAAWHVGFEATQLDYNDSSCLRPVRLFATNAAFKALANEKCFMSGNAKILSRCPVTYGGGIKSGAIVGFLVWLNADFTLYGLTNIANLTRTNVDPLLEIVHGVGGFFIALVQGGMPAAGGNPTNR